MVYFRSWGDLGDLGDLGDFNDLGDFILYWIPKFYGSYSLDSSEYNGNPPQSIQCY